MRRDETLSRPWAKPGTPDLEHRLGGLEKEHETGNVSYDPENHHYMTKLRAEKIDGIAREFPSSEIFGDEQGDLLVIGWGSTRGAIEAAVDASRLRGLKVGAVHLRWLNPLPSDLEEIFGRYNKVLVPELNNGQLVRILRDRFLLPFIPMNKVKGMPFRSSEIEEQISEIVGTLAK